MAKFIRCDRCNREINQDLPGVDSEKEDVGFKDPETRYVVYVFPRSTESGTQIICDLCVDCVSDVIRSNNVVTMGKPKDNNG